MRRYAYLYFLLLFLVPKLVQGSHQAGGEYQYTYLGNGTYRVTFYLYQDCQNGTPNAITDDNPANFAIYAKSNPKKLILVRKVNYSSSQLVPYGVKTECFTKLPNMCILKKIFEFDFTLPDVNTNEYDPSGYLVVYQRCCRNSVISNLVNPGSIGVTFITEIPSQGVLTNNSPIYLHPPPLIICKGVPSIVDYSAYDPDGDSLSYSFGKSLVYLGKYNIDKPDTPSPPPYSTARYSNPYTYDAPLKSDPPIYINPTTGILHFTPQNFGIFVVVIKVSEYRNGVLIASHNREFQYYVTSCSKVSFAEIPQRSTEAGVHQIVCNGYKVYFDNKSTGANSYSWDFGDPTTLADTSHEKFPFYTYPDTGVYLVSLITDRELDCPDSTSKLVKIYPYFKADFSNNGGYCPDSIATFIDLSTYTYGSIKSITWNFGDGKYGEGSPIRHQFPNETKIYDVVMTATSTFGCQDSASTRLSYKRLVAFAGNDTVVIQDEPIKFNSQGDLINIWTPPTYLNNANIAVPTAIFPDTGTYTYILYVENELGCNASDTVTYIVSEGPYFYIPNAFTPNADGNNDFIRLYTSGIQTLHYFRIYNRYGQEIFYSMDFKKSWDGNFKNKELPVGVYYWMAEGIDYRGKLIQRKGDITLIR